MNNQTVTKEYYGHIRSFLFSSFQVLMPTTPLVLLYHDLAQSEHQFSSIWTGRFKTYYTFEA